MKHTEWLVVRITRTCHAALKAEVSEGVSFLSGVARSELKLLFFSILYADFLKPQVHSVPNMEKNASLGKCIKKKTQPPI